MLSVRTRMNMNLAVRMLVRWYIAEFDLMITNRIVYYSLYDMTVAVTCTLVAEWCSACVDTFPCSPRRAYPHWNIVGITINYWSKPTDEGGQGMECHEIPKSHSLSRSSVAINCGMTPLIMRNYYSTAWTRNCARIRHTTYHAPFVMISRCHSASRITWWRR